MPQTLALIHTSTLFFTKEPALMDLFDEIIPDVRLINLLDDSLLADVMSEGGVSPAVTQRLCDYVRAAEQAGADAALCLCSSVGPAVDVARGLVRIPVVKIDDAHTEQAVRQADRIGALATVATTLRPTVDLIRTKAATMNRNVEVVEELAGSALAALMQGDREGHDEMLVAAAKKLASQVDVILFAQASMTRLQPIVEGETGLPVLTSPRLAVERVKAVLKTAAESSQAAYTL